MTRFPSFKKCTMRTNVFNLVLNIHNSKLTMQELQDSKGFNNVFFVGLLYHLKQNIDHGSPRWKNKTKLCLKINLLKNKASTKDNGIFSLTINNLKSSSNSLW